jgi:3-phosphoglycerate kinase
MLRILSSKSTLRNLKEKNPAKVIISHAFMVGRLQNQNTYKKYSFTAADRILH